VKDLFDLLNKLAKTFFTGKLTINFHKGIDNKFSQG